MAKQTLPAWQQVLLTALNNTPDASNGQEAWEKLNDGEKVAVMAFLAGQVGEDKAQEALEETLPKARPKGGIRQVVLIVVYMAAVLGSWFWMKQRGEVVLPWIWILISSEHVYTELKDAYRRRMERIWREREETEEGVKLALAEMRSCLELPRWKAADRFQVIFYSVSLIVWVILLLL